MPFDPAIAARFDEAARRWDEEDEAEKFGDEPADPEPDGDGDDLPPLPVAAPPQGEMLLPEMDFSGPSEPPRLRAPQPEPATAGAGQKGALPAEPAASLDWKGLADRLGWGAIGNADSKNYESLFANVGAKSGYRPNANAGNVLTESARVPLDVAKEKQGYESRDLALKGQKAALGQKAADADPNSLASQKARESVKSMGIKLPAGFENWSAADIQRFVKTGDLARLESVRAKTAGDQAKAEKADAELQAMRKTWTPELKAAGKDPNTATKFDVQQVQAAKRAAATEKLANSNYALAAKREERSAGEHDALSNDVPFAGTQLKYRGKGTPREDDRREVQKVSSLYGAAISGMDDLGAALDEFARHPSPETKDNVASKAHVVGGHLNTAAGQGAMSKDEAAAMTAALGTDVLNPTGFQAFVEKFIGDDAKAAAILTRKLKSVRETARTSAMGKVRAYNYDADAPAAKIRVKRLSDGQPGSILPSDFDPAKYEKL